MIVCQHCGEELRFERGRGWVHQEGGTYKVYCPDCDWAGAPYPSPAFCPACGGEGLRDDHCALLVKKEEAKQWSF